MARRKVAPREEAPSGFSQILERLLHLEPAAVAAIVVDALGESVDYAGELSSFDTKIAGVHFRVVWDEISHSALAGALVQIVVRARDRTFVMRRLPDGYALVVVLARRAFSSSPRALAVVERELSLEAGWPVPTSRPWYPVEVQSAAPPPERSHARRRLQKPRPARLRESLPGAGWEPLEVLGSVMGLRRERGYRCRLKSGAELTLIREPTGRWYADEHVGRPPERLTPLFRG